ncbi:MAG: class II glutamine amidotransferase [Pseudomonadota bacterium]
MCELLGMNARYPTDVDTSLDLFRPRGGEVGPHADGWGLAFFEERAARLLKEPVPACNSRCLHFLQGYGLKSRTVIAHIRRANPPMIGRAYANTHPFEREVGGKAWVFAHNGILPGIATFELGRYRPMGNSDSEWAFCLLMDAIHDCISHSGKIADIQQLLACLVPIIEKINPLDEFNFLLGNDEHLFVHAHSELHFLRRECCIDGCDQRVILIATKPLSEEAWQCLLPNTLLVLKDGEIVREVRTSGAASPLAWQRRREQEQLVIDMQAQNPY